MAQFIITLDNGTKGTFEAGSVADATIQAQAAIDTVAAELNDPTITPPTIVSAVLSG